MNERTCFGDAELEHIIEMVEGLINQKITVVVEFDNTPYGEPFTGSRTQKYGKMEVDGDWVIFPGGDGIKGLGRVRLRRKRDAD